MHALKGVVETERLDGCEFEPRRSYDVFLSEGDASAAAAAWRACVGRGDAWTRDVSLVGPDMAEGVTGVRGARAAFSVPCCSLWPYKFVTGLLEAAMRRNPGLSLHTETPVLGVGAVDGGSSLVVTDRGPVRAKKVVFATNAYTAGLLPRYRNVIMPYKGTCAHLAALGREEPVFPHLANTYNVDFGLEGKEGLETVDYLNPRPDGGIVVGGGKWVFEENRHLWYNTVDDSTQIGPIMKAKYFDGYMQRTFKGWENSGTETEQVWTGSKSMVPRSSRLTTQCSHERTNSYGQHARRSSACRGRPWGTEPVDSCGLQRRRQFAGISGGEGRRYDDPRWRPVRGVRGGDTQTVQDDGGETSDESTDILNTVDCGSLV